MKDEDRSLPRVVHGILVVEFGLLGYERGQIGKHDGFVFVLLINGRLEVGKHNDRNWYFESLICES